MGTRILEGVRINEGDKPGAVFYNSTDGMAFGPVFDNAEEAERFVSFLSRVDPGAFLRGWSNDELSTPYSLYKLWLELGKPAKRPVVQLDPSYLHKNDKKWGMACSLVEHCFPLFLGYDNHEVTDLLKKAGVIGDAEVDPESSCFYAYFTSKKQGEQFLWRLNGWLRENWHKAYPEQPEPTRKRSRR